MACIVEPSATGDAPLARPRPRDCRRTARRYRCGGERFNAAMANLRGCFRDRICALRPTGTLEASKRLQTRIESDQGGLKAGEHGGTSTQP
jgi:hypothetical protein